jgi:uncharacterized OB-fold protein
MTRKAVFYYPPVSGSTVTIRSSSESPIKAQDCPSPPFIFMPPRACCRDIGGPGFFTDVLGPTQMVDLSHLVPPFHLEVLE